MPATKTAASKCHAEHAPELLYQLSKASQDGLPAGAYLKLAATKRYELHAAIRAYAPGVGESPRKFADALRPLVGKEVDYCGERLTLKSRYVNCRHQTEFAVDGTLRHRIMKARDTANDREAKISETAHVLAVELRKHGDPVAAVAAVLPTIAPAAESRPAPTTPYTGLTGREASLQDTARWERRDSLPLPPVREPAVLELDPEPAAPAVADTTRRDGESMHQWFTRTGLRPSDCTPPRSPNVRLAPKGDESGVNFDDCDLHREQREKARKPWSVF